jgi:hypothetical protein
MELDVYKNTQIQKGSAKPQEKFGLNVNNNWDESKGQWNNKKFPLLKSFIAIL